MRHSLIILVSIVALSLTSVTSCAVTLSKGEWDVVTLDEILCNYSCSPLNPFCFVSESGPADFQVTNAHINDISLDDAQAGVVLNAVANPPFTISGKLTGTAKINVIVNSCMQVAGRTIQSKIEESTITISSVDVDFSVSGDNDKYAAGAYYCILQNETEVTYNSLDIDAGWILQISPVITETVMRAKIKDVLKAEIERAVYGEIIGPFLNINPRGIYCGGGDDTGGPSCACE